MVRLTSFDLYPKTLKEFKQRTLTGAIVSVACAALIAILTVVEIADYAQVRTHDHLSVDISRGQQMRINLNITFPALPCSVLTLEVLDLSGNHLPDTRRHIQKTRLDVRGAPLPGGQLEPERRRGPVIIGMPGASRRMLAVDDGAKRGTGGGAKPVAELNLPSLDLLSKPDTLLSELLSQMLPQIFEDKEAIDELQRHVGEGCHIEGHLMVNRVAGRFHFSLTHADHHTLLKVFQTRESLNVSHVIHTLSFGAPLRRPNRALKPPDRSETGSSDGRTPPRAQANLTRGWSTRWTIYRSYSTTARGTSSTTSRSCRRSMSRCGARPRAPTNSRTPSCSGRRRRSRSCRRFPSITRSRRSWRA